MPRRVSNKKKYRSEKPKKKVSFLKLLFVLGSAFLIFYSIFFVVKFFSVKSVDVTLSNNSGNYLLAGKSGDLEKTLIIFEEGEGNGRRVTDVYVYLVNSVKKQEMLLYVSGDIYFSGLEERFGNEIAVSSFRYAGDFLQSGRGIEYAVWQFNQLFGFKSNNYIFISAEASAVLNDSFSDTSGASGSIDKLEEFDRAFSYERIFLNSSELDLLDGKIYSNLSFQNVRLKLGQASGGNAKYVRSVLDFSGEKFLREGTLITGEEISVIDVGKSDKEFKVGLQFVLDRQLEMERGRVEVYNGSDISGAAGGIGRKIANSGCDVVRYGNAPENVERTKVYVADMERFKNSYDVVDDSLEIDFELISGRPDFMTTGDIVIILGKDIELMYSF